MKEFLYDNLVIILRILGYSGLIFGITIYVIIFSYLLRGVF